MARSLPDSIRCRLPYLLAKSHQRQLNLFDRHTADLGISARDYGLMLVVESNPAIWQSEIAKLMGLDRTTVTYLVDGLEKRGWLQRRRDPADRRAHVISLTAEGVDALAAIRPATAAATDELLAPLDDHERKQLQTLLMRLLGSRAC